MSTYFLLKEDGVYCFLLQAQLDPGCPDINQADCSPNPVTLFAPTDTAFANLASQLGTTPAGLLLLPQLADILLYHITDPTQLTVPLAGSDGDLVSNFHPFIFIIWLCR